MIVQRFHEKFSPRRFEGGNGLVFMKNFYLEVTAVRLITASWAPKTFDSYRLDTVYAKRMKNICLADSNELMAVRLISPLEPQYVEFVKNFYLADPND